MDCLTGIEKLNNLRGELLFSNTPKSPNEMIIDVGIIILEDIHQTIYIKNQLDLGLVPGCLYEGPK